MTIVFLPAVPTDDRNLLYKTISEHVCRGLAVCIGGLAMSVRRVHIWSFSNFKYRNFAKKLLPCQKNDYDREPLS